MNNIKNTTTYETLNTLSSREGAKLHTITLQQLTFINRGHLPHDVRATIAIHETKHASGRRIVRCVTRRFGDRTIRREYTGRDAERRARRSLQQWASRVIRKADADAAAARRAADNLA